MNKQIDCLFFMPLIKNGKEVKSIIMGGTRFDESLIGYFVGDRWIDDYRTQNPPIEYKLEYDNRSFYR